MLTVRHDDDDDDDDLQTAFVSMVTKYISYDDNHCASSATISTYIKVCCLMMKINNFAQLIFIFF